MPSYLAPTFVDDEELDTELPWDFSFQDLFTRPAVGESNADPGFITQPYNPNTVISDDGTAIPFQQGDRIADKIWGAVTQSLEAVRGALVQREVDRIQGIRRVDTGGFAFLRGFQTSDGSFNIFPIILAALALLGIVFFASKR